MLARSPETFAKVDGRRVGWSEPRTPASIDGGHIPAISHPDTAAQAGDCAKKTEHQIVKWVHLPRADTATESPGWHAVSPIMREVC